MVMGLGITHNMTSLNKYQPSKARILVKVSAVNCCKDQLKTKIITDMSKCIFVRVVRTGPNVEDSANIFPGALLAVRRNAGIKLEKLSRIQRQEFRMIKESHIIAYADF
ncbi:unnamed protein product [Allacma fusca]|uniref:Uncharacterized protein n=1 Tax=Allacma fusca TaxID=39272 RepID=A0A8J2L129_9HEXA|nr:unnamed protein product [Allacma fusca]